MGDGNKSVAAHCRRSPIGAIAAVPRTRSSMGDHGVNPPPNKICTIKGVAVYRDILPLLGVVIVESLNSMFGHQGAFLLRRPSLYK